MRKSLYPIAARYPVALAWPEDRDFLALLSSEQQQQLVADLQQLARIECQTTLALQALAEVDLYAAGIAYQTIQTAELMKLLYGASTELEAFDEARRAQFLQTLSELIAAAHVDILSFLRGG